MRPTGPALAAGLLAAAAATAAATGRANGPATRPATTTTDLLLEAIRREHDMPAIAAAAIRDGRVGAVGAVGERKAGSGVTVTPADRFHIGSCTKAMTATMIARLVQDGLLRWEMTVEQGLPEIARQALPAYRKMTLRHLLTHRAGLIKDWPKSASFRDVHDLPGPPRKQREAFVAMVLRRPPVARPGEEFHYSNAGYTVAAAFAERAADAPWETLMRRLIFEPLGMTSAGFGAMGTPGKIDQPWQHRLAGKKRVPVGPGRLSDNPPAIGPGGTVHCSMGDWAKFVAAHLAGARGEKTPLKLTAETWRQLHTTPPGGNYAMGWAVTERSWGGGRVLTHAGSNTMNFAVVWMAPKRSYAVLVATNQGGEAAAKACDKAAATLIRAFPPVTRRTAQRNADGREEETAEDEYGRDEQVTDRWTTSRITIR